MAIPTMTELLEAGVHFGHQVRRWSPKMAPYIFAARDGVHIIDLAETTKALAAACEFVKLQAKSGKTILFLGTKRQAVDIIAEEAKRVGAFYITERWIGGFLTNFENVFKNIEKLNSLKEKRSSGEFDSLTKKEQLIIDRQINRLEKFYRGVENIKGIPDIIYVVDCKREHNAILEARRKGVKLVAICDTNCDPTLIDYPIPGNDDAIKAIKIITAAIADAYLEGRLIFEKTEKAQPATKTKGDSATKNEKEPTAKKSASKKSNKIVKT